MPALEVRRQRGLVELLRAVARHPLRTDWDAVVGLQVTCLRHGTRRAEIPDLIVRRVHGVHMGEELRNPFNTDPDVGSFRYYTETVFPADCALAPFDHPNIPRGEHVLSFWQAGFEQAEENPAKNDLFGNAR